MNNKFAFWNFLHRLGGCYLIPHELLHVLAYRIIGKPYRYRWGDHCVHSLAPKSKWEKLFVLLFPFVVCWALGLLFGLLWILSAFFIEIPPERYFVDGPTWHFVFPVVATLFIIYSGTAHQDLIEAYGWLFKYQAKYDSPEPHQQAEEEQPHRHHP